MDSLLAIIDMILQLATWLIFAHFIMSWLLAFNVLNPRQTLVQQVWRSLAQLLEPIYRPVRRILPVTAGLDLAPLVVLIGIYALRIILANNS